MPEYPVVCVTTTARAALLFSESGRVGPRHYPDPASGRLVTAAIRDEL